MLRKHQQEFKQIIDRICSGSPIRTIYCPVTPGGGKSLLPVLAGQLIESGLADRIMWAAPRLSLLDQGEREFVNPRWREELGHRITVRSSTNEIDPSRGLHGFCTTMQAVGLDEGILPVEFGLHRYILVLDEGHHIAVNSLWESKFKELWDRAAFRIFLSGTLERGDQDLIAFLPYRQNGCGLVPDLQETDDTAVIRYSRSDALAERAIIPLSFHLSDGEAEWEDCGQRVRVSSMDRMREDDASKAIYTALKTEYADHLLEAGIQHWREHRRAVPHAKCLIVCSSIEEAKRHTGNLKGMGIKRFAIATSEDTPNALKAIHGIKQDRLDVLVTVAMAYEGLSIEAISHIVCLTRYRSTPWLEQCVARANRIDPNAGPYETQMGHIFAPADPLFKAIVSRIETEQLTEIRRRERAQAGELEAGQPGLFGERSPGNITPLSSAMTGKRVIIVSGSGLQPFYAAAIDPATPILSPSEIETDLLQKIERHIRQYAFNNRYNPKRINAEIRAWAGKPRAEMTIKELESCLQHVRQTYPMDRRRGTGRRVDTKAKPFPCEWTE